MSIECNETTDCDQLEGADNDTDWQAYVMLQFIDCNFTERCRAAVGR